MSRPTPSLLVSLSFVAFLSGCAAIGARQGVEAAPHYAGVHDDLYYFSHPEKADHPSLQILNIIDLPFSAIVDTVMLPFDSKTPAKPTQVTQVSNQSTDPTPASGTPAAGQPARHP
jgi:uncharacterized protein YceK